MSHTHPEATVSDEAREVAETNGGSPEEWQAVMDEREREPVFVTEKGVALVELVNSFHDAWTLLHQTV